jgi:hypothetical protein
MGTSASKILTLSRALIEIVCRQVLADNLQFRGCTALCKLHLRLARYS